MDNVMRQPILIKFSKYKLIKIYIGQIKKTQQNGKWMVSQDMNGEIRRNTNYREISVH